MSVLVELKALVEALEAEVADLDKRRAEVSASFVKLNARKTFLEESIAKLEEEYAGGKATIDANIANHVAATELKKAEVTHSLEQLQKTIADTQLKIQLLEADYEAKASRYTRKLEELRREAETKDAELIATTTDVADSKNELEMLQTTSNTLKADIADLELQLENKKKVIASDSIQLEADIAALTDKRKAVVASLDDKYEELDALNDKLNAAKQIIVEASTREAKSKEYEKRAIKALQAREEAILNKESELAVTTRRRGILNNLQYYKAIMATPRTNAGHDQNFVPTLMGVSSADGITPVPVEVDPSTGQMLVTFEVGASAVYQSFNDTTTDTNLVYLGKAVAGSDPTDAAWQIKRYNKSAGTMTFADDITTFTKQWSARTGYTY